MGDWDGFDRTRREQQEIRETAARLRAPLANVRADDPALLAEEIARLRTQLDAMDCARVMAIQQAREAERKLTERTEAMGKVVDQMRREHAHHDIMLGPCAGCGAIAALDATQRGKEPTDG